MKVLFFGKGTRAKKILNYEKDWLSEIDIIAFVDNAHKKGTEEFFLGKRVIYSDEISNFDYDAIVILSTFEEEIRRQLEIDLYVPKNKIMNIEELAKYLTINSKKCALNCNVIIYGLGETFKRYICALKQRFNIIFCSDINMCRGGGYKDILKSYNIDFIDISKIKDLKYDYILLTSNEDKIENDKNILKDNNISESKILFKNEWEKQIMFPIIKQLGNKNSDKIFYIIFRNSLKTGLMTTLNLVIEEYYYCIKMKYIPIIDMKNGLNLYLEENELGKVNAWEYYFNQFQNINLDEVYQSKNVIIPALNTYHNYLTNTMNKQILYKKREIFNNEIGLSEIAKEYINKQYENIFKGKNRILGVLYRGTDYKNIKPKNHFIQPDINELIKIVKKYFEEWNCNYIYLATEDEDGLNIFKEKFNSKLLYTNQKRFSNTGQKFLGDIKIDRKRDKYLRGMEYLASIYLLSRCDCLIGARCGGLDGALILKENDFEHEYIIDLGRY